MSFGHWITVLTDFPLPVIAKVNKLRLGQNLPQYFFCNKNCHRIKLSLFFWGQKWARKVQLSFIPKTKIVLKKNKRGRVYQAGVVTWALVKDMCVSKLYSMKGIYVIPVKFSSFFLIIFHSSYSVIYLVPVHFSNINNKDLLKYSSLIYY